MDAAKNKITVVELLRREGCEPPAEQRAGGRAAATAAGVAAMCGATVTGMIALAPSLDTSFLPGDPDRVLAAGASYSDGGLSPVDSETMRMLAERVGGGQTEGAADDRRVSSGTVGPLGGGPVVSAGAAPRTPAMSQISDPVRPSVAGTSSAEEPEARSAGGSPESGESDSMTTASSEPSESGEPSRGSPEPSEPKPSDEPSEPSQEDPEPSESKPSEPSESSQNPEPSESKPSEEPDEPSEPNGESDGKQDDSHGRSGDRGKQG